MRSIMRFSLLHVSPLNIFLSTTNFIIPTTYLPFSSYFLYPYGILRALFSVLYVVVYEKAGRIWWGYTATAVATAPL